MANVADRGQLLLIAGLMIAAGVLMISAILNASIYTMNIGGLNVLRFELEEHSDLIQLLKSELRAGFRNASGSATETMFNARLNSYISNLSYYLVQLHGSRGYLLELSPSKYNNTTGLITHLYPPWNWTKYNITWCGDLDLRNCSLRPYSLGCWLIQSNKSFWAAPSCSAMERELGNTSYHYKYINLVIIENSSSVDLKFQPRNITLFLSYSSQNLLIFNGYWDLDFLNWTMNSSLYCNATGHRYEALNLFCWNVSGPAPMDHELNELCINLTPQAGNIGYVSSLHTPVRAILASLGDQVRYPLKLNQFLIPAGAGSDHPLIPFRHRMMVKHEMGGALALNWSCGNAGAIYSLGWLEGDVYRNGSLILERDLRLIYDLFGTMQLELNLSSPRSKLKLNLTAP